MARIDDLRAQGWAVAVHNDYRLNGGSHTFWLLTHPCGRWVKGEGTTDEAAIAQCVSQIDDAEMVGTVERHDADCAAKAAHDATITKAIKALRIWTGHDSHPNIRHNYGERWWEPIEAIKKELEALIGVQP